MRLNVSVFANYDKIKDYIYPRVCNLSTNMKRLANIPYMVKEDLAITYHVKVNSDRDTVGSFVINGDLLGAYDVDLETSHNQAMRNLETISPANFQPLSEVMIEIMAPDFAAS